MMAGQNLGQYRLLQRVARGGMGTVYRALDETLDREVAIKILDGDFADHERFRVEATTIARLNHPGIATVYELFQHDHRWVMVMEFVTGDTLEDLLEGVGQLAPEQAADLCLQALAALAYSHRMGVIHRDLKPGNLMVTTAGTVKIMDFGIARVIGSAHITNAGFALGTPAYMAPEQVQGEATDARADLYAIGVIFYRLITGKLPFEGKTPFAMAQAQVSEVPPPVRSVNPDLPEWTDEIITRALSKNPDGRFQSADEFRHALRGSLDRSRTLTSRGLDDRTERLPVAPPDRSARSSMMWPSLAAAGLVVSLIGTRVWWRGVEGWTRSANTAILGALPLPLSAYGLLVPGLHGRSSARDAGWGAPPIASPVNREARTPPATFSKVKLIAVDGSRATSRDIVLSFADDHVALLPNDGGAPIAIFPYAQVVKATYVHARDPQWEPSPGAPRTKVNGAGILGRSRHWLAVQTKDLFAILQLDGDHWANILQTFERRSGHTVARPEENSRDAAYAGRPK